MARRLACPADAVFPNRHGATDRRPRDPKPNQDALLAPVPVGWPARRKAAHHGCTLPTTGHHRETPSRVSISAPCRTAATRATMAANRECIPCMSKVVKNELNLIHKPARIGGSHGRGALRPTAVAGRRCKLLRYKEMNRNKGTSIVTIVRHTATGVARR